MERAAALVFVTLLLALPWAPQPLAAGGNDMTGNLWDQRDVGLHLLQDQRVDRDHIVAAQILQRLQRVSAGGAIRVDRDRLWMCRSQSDVAPLVRVSDAPAICCRIA